MEAQISSTLVSSSARIAAIVEGFTSQAFCIAFALTATKFNASEKLKQPFATNAENSPSECPATISGVAVASVLKAITECKKTAGCVTFVCFSSSAVPKNITSEIEK